MNLSLQFGWGMMEHSRSLIDRWGGGEVILSPRDLKPEQLTSFAESIRDLESARVVLDPQFYLPHSDHGRLRSHDYWPDDYETGNFWEGESANELLESLWKLNREIGASAFILPGLLADRIDSDWLLVQQEILDRARNLGTDKPLWQTIALSSEALRDENQIGELLESAENQVVDGNYVVCEHPNGQYLVEDATWLANVLDLVVGLRLLGRHVLLGYCTHQMLVASVTGVNAIASGTWMNVRSFPPEKFRSSYEEEMKRRATWYYCPQTLSEYKITFLDIAQRRGLIGELAPTPALSGGDADALFSGAQPSAVGYGEREAFRHYLHCLQAQCRQVEGLDFDARVDLHSSLLNEAESLIHRLSMVGIRGQERDFSGVIDINRAALSLLVSTRGPILRHNWNDLA